MIKAVIFDCFGVLITDALQMLSDELRVKDAAAAEELVEIVRTMNRGLTAPDQGRLRMAELLGISLAELQRKLARGEHKNAALFNYIAHLRETYKTAILSNVPAGSLQRRFSSEELAGNFDAVVASGDIGHIKPDPQAYLAVARQLGVKPEECVFVDDRETQARGAETVGMRAVHYRDYNQFKQELERVLANG